MDQLLASLAHIPPLAVYGFVFIWLAAESAGAPVPNEVVLLLAGSLATKAELSAPVLVLVALAGSVGGASLAYAIGARGGRAAVLRFGRIFRLDEKRLDDIEVWFSRSGWLAIFIARITPFVRTVASYPAGMLRLPRRTFYVATVAGSLVWCTVLVTLGDVLGKNYTVALKLIEQYTIPAIIVLALLVAGYLWLHNRLKHTTPKHLTEAELEAIHEREQH
jgi:membrane protein DedA with SNARE-associated domain